MGVSDAELFRGLHEEASTYGATIHHMRVHLLERTGTGWRVGAGAAVARPVVLLATGVVDHLPTLVSGDPETVLRDGLLRACVLCGGYEVTEQRIAVIRPVDRAIFQCALPVHILGRRYRCAFRQG